MDTVATMTTIRSIHNQASEPDMSIILVCWNNKNYLGPCLDSLYSGDVRCSFDVIVVDNGSTDGSQAMLREKYPQVQIIQNNHNAGLGRASNQGILATTGRYVLLLNNDTLVNGSSLNALVDFLEEQPEVGAVGGRLLNPDGTLQAGFNNFPSLHEELLVATRLGERLSPIFPSHRGDERARSVCWMGSACVLLRRAALDQVGLLDESYFIYGDEADLQFRLKKAGWKVYYLPSAYTIHYGGRSMDRWRRRKMVYRGKIMFFQKNYGPLRTGLLRLLFGGTSLAKLVAWQLASFSPRWREQAHKELQSNVDVIKLCWKLS
jgi:GT2 family glycosyltransferase